jgi:hypothetical protein
MPTVEIHEDDLAKMEAVFQHGLELCHRLRKKLGDVSTSPNPKRGLDRKQVADLVTSRKKTIIKKLQRA